MWHFVVIMKASNKQVREFISIWSKLFVIAIFSILLFFVDQDWQTYQKIYRLRLRYIQNLRTWTLRLHDASAILKWFSSRIASMDRWPMTIRLYLMPCIHFVTASWKRGLQPDEHLKPSAKTGKKHGQYKADDSIYSRNCTNSLWAACFIHISLIWYV